MKRTMPLQSPARKAAQYTLRLLFFSFLVFLLVFFLGFGGLLGCVGGLASEQPIPLYLEILACVSHGFLLP